MADSQRMGNRPQINRDDQKESYVHFDSISWIG